MPLLPDDFESHSVWKAEKDVSRFIKQQSPFSDARIEEVVQWTRLALADVRSIRHIESWRFPSSEALDELAEALDSVNIALVENGTEDTETTVAAFMSAIDEMNAALAKSPLHLVQKEREDEMQVALQEHNLFLRKTLNELNSSVEDISVKAIELEDGISSQKVHIDTQVKRLDSIVDGQAQAFADKTLEWKEDSEKAAAVIAKRGETHIAEMRSLENESRNLVSSTARWSISTNYGLYARNQSIAAWVWSILAMLTLGAGFFWVSDVVQKFEGDGTAPILMTEGILKFTVTSILVVAAGFMMKSASGHRAESRDAKRTQLDLNTLEPFIREMSPEDRAAMRMKFARKIFGRPMANSKTDAHYLWGDTEETSQSEKDEPDALDKVK